MWDAKLPVMGSCPACGGDLGTAVRIRATTRWGARYESEGSLRRAVDRAVARYVMERHEEQCTARHRRAS